MRVDLTVDGKARSVEVDLDAGTVTVDGTARPYRVVDAGDERVELEIDGERVVVEGWPVGRAEPLRDLAVNGERVELAGLRRQVGTPDRAPSPRPVGAPPVVGPPAPGPGPSASSDAVVPPMPGKVVELKVQEGEHVAAGQLLLVLEAMKMRNDVVAPRAGTVRELRVAPGANVRAREPMLRVVAD